MIRFSCAHCSRPYLLPDALARLPLLCKGCGQPLTVPDPQPEPAEPLPAPPPVAPPKPAAVVLPPAPTPPPRPAAAAAAAVPVPAPAAPPRPSSLPPALRLVPTETELDLEELLSSSALSGQEWESRPPAPAPDLPAVRPEPPPPPIKLAPAAESSPPPAAAPAPGRMLIGGVVDGAVVLLLVAAGAVLGEVVARKSTREVLEHAGSAPVFPPTDLLLWLGCVAALVLVYVWFGARGWTVGGWLRRRAA